MLNIITYTEAETQSKAPHLIQQFLWEFSEKYKSTISKKPLWVVT